MTRGRPEGFLLLAGLGVLSLCGALFVWVALLGGVLSDKQRAAHLADTAALSAAGWFAQSLNYQAYANRAIAANEIMIAQSMTLLAWVDYASRLAGNSATVASVVPALQPLMGYVQEAATISREVTRGAVSLEVPEWVHPRFARLARGDAGRRIPFCYPVFGERSGVVWRSTLLRTVSAQ